MRVRLRRLGAAFLFVLLGILTLSALLVSALRWLDPPFSSFMAQDWIGDLDLHGVTRSLTFDATVTLVSEERIEGYASTTILYSDFNIVVPQPPPVSFIADEVVMEIEFVALAVEE